MNQMIHGLLAQQKTATWHSSLTEILVNERKNRPHSKAFPSCSDYSTSEYLFGSSTKPCRTFFVSGQQLVLSPNLRIECLPPSVEAEFSLKGLSFVPHDDPLWPEISQTILRASHLISFEPMLAKNVDLLVHSLHILSTDDPAYDISFSEPTLPFSIFTNIPEIEVALPMRTAEAIIHEAMHLQLTLVEQLAPIDNGDDVSLYSPWKDKKRPISGLMHAMYVFSVIDQWLESVEVNSLLKNYASNRREQIRHEISLVEIDECLRQASNIGKTILQQILMRFNQR